MHGDFDKVIPFDPEERAERRRRRASTQTKGNEITNANDIDSGLDDGMRADIANVVTLMHATGCADDRIANFLADVAQHIADNRGITRSE